MAIKVNHLKSGGKSVKCGQFVAGSTYLVDTHLYIATTTHWLVNLATGYGFEPLPVLAFTEVECELTYKFVL